ncbi:MAG TPA: ThuA domain-containing protein [Tepidisphaeraceae bacterium]|nr:ThuA domain-containing protein [Tepidisphaeraceae bacterium]
MFRGITQIASLPGCLLMALLVASCAVAAGPQPQAPNTPAPTLHLLTRSRAEITPKSGKFEVVEQTADLDPKQTALIICDLWDKHWCDGATGRVGIMAPRIDALAKALRAKGALIVHAPSDTMGFYKDTPQRKRAIDAPLADTKVAFKWNVCDPAVEPPLPIDDSDGGCDSNQQPPKGGPYPWKREHPAVEVFPEDAVSDQGREIYNLFVQHGIRNVLYCGVHANMCVLGRSFGIREMRKLGLNPLLVRDLTDTMYNPKMRPFVPHDRGTDLVVEHIEKYWCPSILSSEVIGDAKPANIVFAIAEDEYHASETLPAFAKEHLEGKLNCKCVFLQSDSKTDLPGLEALKSADVLVMFMRRRSLPDAELKAFQAYFDAGKPVVGIRTACHSFQTWLDFDSTVLGCHYNNHYPAGKSAMTVKLAERATRNPILRNIAPTWTTPSSLYKVLPLNAGCTPLLTGTWEDKPAEPIAWTTTYDGGRVFFTSLGSPDDFKDENFQKLLDHGILWALDRAIPK